MPNILEAIGIIVLSIIGLIYTERVRWRRGQGAAFIGILYGVYLIFANIWVGISMLFSPSPTATPTSTHRSQPVATATRVRVPTITPNPCLLWSQVTPQMAGQTVCVYGTIVDITTARETNTRYKFSDQPNTFFMFSDIYFIHLDTGKNVVVGDCISDTEEIKVYDGIPYIDVGERLKFCR